MWREDDEILTVEELAEYLRLHRSTLYNYAREGKIPALHVGGHWRFRLSEIRDWVGLQSDLELYPPGEGRWRYGDDEDEEFFEWPHRPLSDEEKFQGELLRSRLLRKIPQADREAMFERIRWELMYFSGDELLIHRKEPMDYFLMVHSGVMEIPVGSGHMLIEPDNYEQGNIVGLDVCMTKLRTTYFTLLGREEGVAVKVWIDSLLQCRDLGEAVGAQLMENINRYLADENIRRSKKIEMLQMKTQQRRILMYLLSKEERNGGSPFWLHEPISSVADHLNINYSYFSTQLAFLRHERMIIMRENRVWMDHRRIEEYFTKESEEENT